MSNIKDIYNISLSSKDINTIMWALKVASNSMLDSMRIRDIIPEVYEVNIKKKVVSEFEYMAMLTNDIKAQMLGLK